MSPIVRAVVTPELEAKLKARAAKERRTLSQLIAVLLEGAVDK
jgi:hypothetical protein